MKLAQGSLAGRQIGPYRILSFVGAGGMGEVYRAYDSKLRRGVAIKTLPGELAGDADRLARSLFSRAERRPQNSGHQAPAHHVLTGNLSDKHLARI